MVYEVYLGGRQPELQKQFQLMIVGLAVRHLQERIVSIHSGGAVQGQLTIFKIDIRAEVHFRRTCLEDQTTFSPRWERELNLPIQSTWPQQGRVEGIGTICGHDYLRDVESGDAP